MSIVVRCTTCNAKLAAPDNAAGRTSKCPHCGAPVTVPSTSSRSRVSERIVPSAPRIERRQAPIIRTPPPIELPPTRPPAQPEREFADCPFCGEQVLASAKKCKHCGEMLDAALRAAEDARRFAAHSGGGGGGGGAAAASTTVIVHGGPEFPHLLHLVLTLLTCGLWLPIWILHYIVHLAMRAGD